jgi:hypothetical protein
LNTKQRRRRPATLFVVPVLYALLVRDGSAADDDNDNDNDSDDGGDDGEPEADDNDDAYSAGDDEH